MNSLNASLHHVDLLDADVLLVRSVSDAKVAGVCGGVADYFGVDSTLVRVAWIVLSVMPGAVVGGLLVYLAAWFIVPKAPTVS